MAWKPMTKAGRKTAYNSLRRMGAPMKGNWSKPLSVKEIREFRGIARTMKRLNKAWGRL